MRRKAKRLLAALFACVMLVTVLAACNQSGGGDGDSAPASNGDSAPAGGGDSSSAGGGGSSAPAGGDNAPSGGDTGRTLNVAFYEDPGTLDPYNAYGAGGSLPLVRSIFDSPHDFYYDGGDFIPLLVESFDTHSDINYTLHLRQNAVFHNGNKFNADDLMFSMEMCRGTFIQDSCVQAIDFDKTAIVDEFTIDLWLKDYSASHWYAFAMMYVFDKESYDPNTIGTAPNGTGPYKLVEYVPNSHVILEAHDEYWGPAPAIKRIYYHNIEESAQRANALITGFADFGRIEAIDAAYLETQGFTIHSYTPGSAWAIFFNMSADGILGTLEAREAVMHAIDRQAVIDLAGLGNIKIPRWPENESMVDFREQYANMSDVYAIGYDPVRARELAEQSGLVGQTLRMITNGVEAYNLQAEVVQAQLEEIGVYSTIIQYDQAGYLNTMSSGSDFDIAFNPLGGPEMRGVRMFYDMPQFYPCGWEGAEREQMFEYLLTAWSSSDQARYDDYFYRALEIFHRNHPWFAFAEIEQYYAYSPDIAGDLEQVLVDVGSVRYLWWEWN